MSGLEELIRKYKELGIDKQIDYEKLYLYSIITHSTAIEGSTITEVENRLLFDAGISANKPIVEQFMNLDLKKAYEAGLAKAAQHRDYDIAMLCELSALVMANTGSEYKTLSGDFSSAAGELRLVNVSAGSGGKSYMAWEKVPEKLGEFCTWLNRQRSDMDTGSISNIYKLSFLAHFNLVTIHPWADGNGRMSRLVMNMIQTEYGMVPSIVKKESRAEYIESLAASREKDDTEIFLSFMVKHHMDNIKKQIEEYMESVSDDTLNMKDDTINDTLNLSGKALAVYEMIKSNRSISIAEIVEQTGFSRPTVTRAIAKLKEASLIYRKGAKKNGSWEIRW